MFALDSDRSPYRNRGMRINCHSKAHHFGLGSGAKIGGYTPLLRDFDALVIGYHENGPTDDAARTRNGFTPASRIELFKKLKPLETTNCPFSRICRRRRRGAGVLD
jgi:bifunctional non-homologous end joining protein LigD